MASSWTRRATKCQSPSGTSSTPWLSLRGARTRKHSPRTVRTSCGSGSRASTTRRTSASVTASSSRTSIRRLRWLPCCLVLLRDPCVSFLNLHRSGFPRLPLPWVWLAEISNASETFVIQRNTVILSSFFIAQRRQPPFLCNYGRPVRRLHRRRLH